MSDKERAAALLEYVPPYKMGYVVAYLQGLVADELFFEICTKNILKILTVEWRFYIVG